MRELFFKSTDDEFCYTEEHFIVEMEENGIDEMIVFEADKMMRSDIFYCKKHGGIGETAESCGKQCSDYNPRNGKSGCCKHRGFCYENTGISKTLTLK